MGYKFRRQFGIGSYVVDFYCAKLKLIIEIDGLTHAEKEIFENDKKRQRYLENLGLFIKRYNSEDVFKKIDQVVEDIYNTCEYLCNLPGLSATPPS